MKKFLILLLAFLASVGSFAQNANRKGFFVEAAVGGTTGSSPIVAISLDGTTLNGYAASGAAFNVALGPRFRTSNHMSFELRFEVQAPFSNVGTTPVVKLMPAIRYTSKEIAGNMSLYFTVGIGGAFSQGYDCYSDNCYLGILYLPSNGEKYKFKFGDGNIKGGASYLVNVGMNFTTHFYAGLIYDAQVIFSQYSKSAKYSHWGLAGVHVGYRF